MPRTGDVSTRKANGRSIDSVPFVDYEAALDFLNSHINFERVMAGNMDQDSFKLDRIGAMLDALGKPHLAVPVVHIAGSKGKGSTCLMLESCLRSSGYTTGLYTSPHLVDERERVRINGNLIEKSAFSSALAQCRDAAASVSLTHGQATYFELLTALSFVVFAQEAVDIVILETGLGGLLDCTNVVQPIVVGLTSIQLEHTSVLGKTLDEIARQKAGIMKPGVPALSVPQPEEVSDAFKECAKETGCVLSTLGQEIHYSCRFQSSTTRRAHPKVCVGRGMGCFEHMSVPLLGEHQGANCGLALAIVCELRKHGFDLPEQQIIAGLQQTPCNGRLEQINDRPRVMVDGAHTPESVMQTLRAAAQQVEFDSMVVVFGCSSDKLIDPMLENLQARADKVIFTKASNSPRAVDPHDLADRYSSISNKACESYESPIEAVRAGGKSLGANDLLLVLGSFYLAGEIKSLFESKKSAANSASVSDSASSKKNN